MGSWDVWKLGSWVVGKSGLRLEKFVIYFLFDENMASRAYIITNVNAVEHTICDSIRQKLNMAKASIVNTIMQ